MRSIKENKDGYIVSSQPGDGTRYGFTLTKSEVWEAWFIGPYESDIKYPCKISIWDADDPRQSDVVRIAEEDSSNPWTVAEVFRSLLVIAGKEPVIEGFET